MEGPMLQALLEDRFNLKIHPRNEDILVYELTGEGRTQAPAHPFLLPARGLQAWACGR